jgi:hypothetical protein
MRPNDPLMILRGRDVLAAIACAALLAGCGSPQSGVNFQPPSGWKPGISIFGMMQMWTRSDRPGSVMMLMRAPSRGSTGQLDQALRTQFDMQKPLEDKTIKICGNQPARMTVFIGQSKKSSDRDRVEMVRTVVGDSLYMAMYARAASEPADPASESAIKSLCLKKT